MQGIFSYRTCLFAKKFLEKIVKIAKYVHEVLLLMI